MKHKGTLTGQKGNMPNTELCDHTWNALFSSGELISWMTITTPEEDHKTAIKMLSKQRGADLQREIKSVRMHQLTNPKKGMWQLSASRRASARAKHHFSESLQQHGVVVNQKLWEHLLIKTLIIIFTRVWGDLIICLTNTTASQLFIL